MTDTIRQKVAEAMKSRREELLAKPLAGIWDALADAAIEAMHGWRPIATAPKTGFFMAWSPDFPDIPTVWRAEIFHSARAPGTPKHLSANHWTRWMPLPSPPTEESNG